MKPLPDLQRRYDGQPLLRLLDAYVLWAIHALPPEQETLLQETSPNLRKVWQRTEEQWHEILAAQMQFPATLPVMIWDLWQNQQAIAAANQEILLPTAFAYEFVDENIKR